jgi:ribonuclease PH
MMATRADGRAGNEMREVTIEIHPLAFADGSVIISVGRTRVLCAATFEERVPPWMRNRGTGWVTAEYSMLPCATPERSPREAAKGKIGGRTHEIQRLIGRALRSAVNLDLLGERSIVVDCDVIQADGGTRTAAISGAWVALGLAMRKHFLPTAKNWPLGMGLAAVSVGIVAGEMVLDLPYEEDCRAEVDMNVVMTADGRFVELQSTAERASFDHRQLLKMLELAQLGVAQIRRLQIEAFMAAEAP